MAGAENAARQSKVEEAVFATVMTAVELYTYGVMTVLVAVAE